MGQNAAYFTVYSTENEDQFYGEYGTYQDACEQAAFESDRTGGEWEARIAYPDEADEYRRQDEADCHAVEAAETGGGEAALREDRFHRLYEDECDDDFDFSDFQ
jgi:hypothetical protein